MAQLRQDFEEFRKRDTEIVVVGPENTEQFKEFWQKESLPFVGLPDPDHKVLKLYGQQIKLFKLGRMPAQAIIDKTGGIRFVHYGNSMRDIPSNEKMFEILDPLN